MTILEKTLALHDVELFNQVPTEALSFLASIAQEESFEAGEVIFMEKDLASTFHLVLGGRVRLTRGGVEVSFIGAGDVMGAWALLDAEERLVTATTSEPTDVLTIEREAFYDLIADHPTITRATLSSLARRFRRLIRPLEKEISGRDG